MLIGILAWPLAAPAEPFGAVRFGNLSVAGGAILLALAFAAGLIGYFVSWPYGREIGILAAPSGLAIWAIRTGNMASQIQMHPAVDQREALVAGLKWEPLFWLAVAGAGFVGVLCGQRIRSSPLPSQSKKGPKPQPALYLRWAVALVVSVLIAQLALGRLAQDTRMSNGSIGSVMGQPAIGQIVFGVFVAFGIAAFIVKTFLDAGYVWPVLGTALLTPFAVSFYAGGDVLAHLAQHWPAAFFSNTALAVLPIQIVALGIFGAVAGYWTAIRYDYWHKHEI